MGDSTHPRELLFGDCKSGDVEVADVLDRRSSKRVEVADQVWSPISIPDYSDATHSSPRPEGECLVVTIRPPPSPAQLLGFSHLETFGRPLGRHTSRVEEDVPIGLQRVEVQVVVRSENHIDISVALIAIQ